VGSVVFGVGSFVRGKRIVHPVGVAFDATVAIDEPSPLLHGTVLGQPGSLPALVRLSRGLGLPMRDPDVHGFAIRVLAHGRWDEQDLLLASVRRLGAGHDLICRTPSYGTRFSTVVPFDAGAGRFVLWALPRQAMPDDTAVHAGAGTDLSFDLLAAVANTRRPPDPVGVVTLGAMQSPATAEDVRFDPWRSGGAIQPTGTFNTARRLVYPSSQYGRSLRGA
jgi:hypothetical protein